MIGLFHILSTHFIRPAAFLYESIRKFFKNSAIGQVYIRYELSRVLWWCAEEDTSLKTTSTLSFNEHFRSLPGQLINLKKKSSCKILFEAYAPAFTYFIFISMFLGYKSAKFGKFASHPPSRKYLYLFKIEKWAFFTFTLWKSVLKKHVLKFYRPTVRATS